MNSTSSSPAIIASKLHPPRLTSQHIPRRRLVDQLDRNRDRPLTLVCAPAGSGKSTLLSAWVEAPDRPSAWISLDERDNELELFVTYVLTAMRTMFPTATLQTRDLLHALVPPPLEAIATSLSNDLDQIDSDFLLVLDDYHLITNPHIDELLLLLLRHPPRTLHLAIATRVEPPWPLAAFRARGQMTELRFADLQFTAEESAAFLRTALDDALDQDLLTVLHEESGGWAAGLQLMSIIARQEGEHSSVLSQLGASEDVGRYLLEEVFARQPLSVQNHLLQLSILERFCASLGEAVCDGIVTQDEPKALGKAFLADLERRNLFLIALDVRHEFFRFHHLFRRFLVERLRERANPEQIAALHRRASGWFAARGLIEEALEHALAAGDALAAADLVARHRHDLYNHEQFGRLTRWLRLLPIEVKAHNPELLLAEARIATVNWRFTEASVFLDHAQVQLADSPLDQARTEIAWGELTVLRAILDLWDGNGERLVTRLPYALEVLPRDSWHLRGVAHMGIVAGHWQRGDPHRAKTLLTEQLAQTPETQPVYATLLQTQGFLCWLDGDLTNLERTASRLLNVSDELELPDQVALAHYFLGIVYFARNQLEAAEQHLTQAVAARFTMRLMWWCQAAGVLALTQQALGRPTRAQQTLEDADALLMERHAVRLLPDLGAFRAEVDRLQGHLAEASAWAAEVQPGPLTWVLTVVEPRLIQARVYLSQEGSTGIEHAAALLAELRAFCARVPNPRFLMEVEALDVLLVERRGQHEAALQALTRLVLSAKPGGWVRLFVDLGEPMFQLLRELVARRVAPHTIARIVSAFPARHGGSDLPDQTGLIEPLSQREFDVLVLLAGRDSNQEISARLFIARSTVKRHTLNIYRKLQVNDRREAVARARELGLLPAG